MTHIFEVLIGNQGKLGKVKGICKKEHFSGIHPFTGDF
jgi:hypothetical protein